MLTEQKVQPKDSAVPIGKMPKFCLYEAFRPVNKILECAGGQMADNTETNNQDDPLLYFAQRPMAEFDEVVKRADHVSRAALSFYRFRQLGGGRRRDKDKSERDLNEVREREAAMAAQIARDFPEQAEEPATLKKRDFRNPLKMTSTPQYGAHQVSDHPPVRIFQISIIAVLVLFESAANAYFFAQQSEFGLSGGLFQAAAVSLANVAISYFIIGFWGLRHITQPAEMRLAPWDWDRRNYIKLFGMLAIAFGVTMVILVNLSAAHYRNILDLKAEGLLTQETQVAYEPEMLRFWLLSNDTCSAVLNSDIGRSIGGAATNAMCRPFALHSLDAMVLFALGLAISALAAYEGRRSDAHFPGLSDAARKFEGARNELQDALDEYYRTYSNTLKIAEAAENGVILTSEEELGLDDIELQKTDDWQQLDSRKQTNIRKAMDDRVKKYQDLLTTAPEILAAEFDVPDLAVQLVTGKSPKEFSKD